MKTIDETFGKLTINQPGCQKTIGTTPLTPKSEMPLIEEYKNLTSSSQELQLTLKEQKLQLKEQKSLKEQKEKASAASLAAKTFDFLAANYRNSWGKGLERIGYEAQLEAWVASMEGLTQEQVEYGKQKISSGECYPTFPPTGGEFRILCKSKPEYFEPKPAPQAQHHQKPSANVSMEFEFWYRGLKAEQKTKVYEGAVKAWPWLAEFLKQSKESYLDAGFERNMWFTRMVEAFMGYYRITSLRDLR